MSSSHRVVFLGLAGVSLAGCYSTPIVGGGVRSALTLSETKVVPVWGSQGVVVQCPSGIYGIAIDEPWYGNLVRAVTLGIVGARRVQVTCAEAKE